MARAPKSLAVGSLSSTEAEIYTPGDGEVVSPSLVISNNLDTQSIVSVFINDLILAKRKIPGGAGKSWIVAEVSMIKLDQLKTITIKLDTGGDINYFLSGSVVGAE